MKNISYDLHNLVTQLRDSFPSVVGLLLFGSRRHRTRSLRSDLDILVQTTNHIRPVELRAFTENNCPVLDLFLVDGAKAVSVMNESFVQGTDFSDLTNRLQAIPFWSRAQGFLDADIDWVFSVAEGVDHRTTVMTSGVPESFDWGRAAKKHFQAVESAGLPICPYLGYTPSGVCAWLEKLIAQLPALRLPNSKGNGIQVAIHNEYDFQNLFYLVTKPWLSSLAREEVTVKYDGQDKKADFSLFGSQVVIEMKHIKDGNTKAAVLKSLAGLADFYTMHPNIRVLIFAVLVDPSVQLDDRRIEGDFTYLEHQPEVHTLVLRNS